MSEFIAGLPDEYTYEATGWIFLHRLATFKPYHQPGFAAACPPGLSHASTFVYQSELHCYQRNLIYGRRHYRSYVRQARSAGRPGQASRRGLQRCF
jgi:hypothetical protein